MKIILTLLARDEADIIRENILFHLNQGVDFIVATDNDSNDGTTEILREFEKMGVLHYIFQAEHIHAQSKWVTQMARMACSRYNADWVINSDADEFWWPEKGNLKTTLQKIPDDVSVVVVQRKDFIPRTEKLGSVFERMIFKNIFSTNSLGQPLPPKILHRAFADIVVKAGNHDVEASENLKKITTENIEIFHFPLRTYTQFALKIDQGGAALQQNPELPLSSSLTWRMLYEKHKAGELEAYYNSRLISLEILREKLKTGKIARDTRLRNFLQKHSTLPVDPKIGKPSVLDIIKRFFMSDSFIQ